jgi:hypothetical protein
MDLDLTIAGWNIFGTKMLDGFRTFFAAVMVFAGIVDTITAAVNTWREFRIPKL